MPRGGKGVVKRAVTPDPIYGNVLLAKFINNVMQDGKKTTAQRAVYDALDILKEKGLDPIQTFEKALDTVAPKVEVRPKRIGGAAYQVPQEVRGPRKISLAIRWMLDATRKRSSRDYHSFAEKLAAEIQAILANEGEAVKKRDGVQRMADANKAFAHLRF